jgi:hypothetical protein
LSDEIQRYLFYTDFFKDFNVKKYQTITKIVEKFDWKVGALEIGDKPNIFLIYRKLTDKEIAPIMEEVEKNVFSLVKRKGNPNEVFIFTHPVYVLDDVVYRLHGFSRELLGLIYFNLTNDFVTPVSALTTILHESVHLALKGETESEVRGIEAQYLKIVEETGSPVLNNVDLLLNSYRKQIYDIGVRLIEALDINLQPTVSEFKNLMDKATKIEDIIIHKP